MVRLGLQQYTLCPMLIQRQDPLDSTQLSGLLADGEVDKGGGTFTKQPHGAEAAPHAAFCAAR